MTDGSGITATISLLHFWRVLADGAMLTPAGLIKPGYREYRCRDRSPYPCLGHGVGQVMAFESLRRTDDDKCTNEDSKKTLDPEFGAHRDVPCDVCA